MKEIWKLVKKVWPFAKMYICLTKDEAIELRSLIESMPVQLNEYGEPVKLPGFLVECFEKLDK